MSERRGQANVKSAPLVHVLTVLADRGKRPAGASTDRNVSGIRLAVLLKLPRMADMSIEAASRSGSLQQPVTSGAVIHPRWVRITHWINALAMFIMIGSGWQIYDA